MTQFLFGQNTEQDEQEAEQISERRPPRFNASSLRPNAPKNVIVRRGGYRLVPHANKDIPLFATIFAQKSLLLSDDNFADKILLEESAEIDVYNLYETYGNLIGTTFFRDVSIKLDTLNRKNSNQKNSTSLPIVDLILFLHEAPSLLPYLIVETGGSNISLGTGMRINNALEKGLDVNVSFRYRAENNIGLQAEAKGKWFLSGVSANKEILHAPMTLEMNFSANRFWNSQEAALTSSFSEAQPYNEWSVRLSRFGGQEFVYSPQVLSEILNPNLGTPSPFESFRANATGIISGSYWGTSFYASGSVQLDFTSRQPQGIIARRNLDNTALALVELGTELRSAYLLREELWGSTEKLTPTSLGKMIPTGFYAQGGLMFGVIWDVSNGIQSLRTGGYYPFIPAGRIGTMNVIGERLYYSLQTDFLGDDLIRAEVKLHCALHDGIVLATRGRVRIPFLPQNILDNNDGVRGVGMNAMLGRYGNASLVCNAELRGLPIGSLGRYSLKGACFFDYGINGSFVSSDNKLTAFGIMSVGAGLRLHYPAFLNSEAGEGVLRVDLAYLPVVQRFGQIVISTREVFNLFDDFPARQERQIGRARLVE